MYYSGGVACSPGKFPVNQGVLFENSIVCLVVFVCLFGHALASRVGVWLLFFDASLFGVFLLGFRFF
jgi:hypothetical protein